MNENDIRRIIREEIERSREVPSHRGIPLPPSTPYVPFQPGYPQPYFPLPTYYPWTVT